MRHERRDVQTRLARTITGNDPEDDEITDANAAGNSMASLPCSRPNADHPLDIRFSPVTRMNEDRHDLYRTIPLSVAATFLQPSAFK